MDRITFESRNPATFRDLERPAVRDRPFPVRGLLNLPERPGSGLLPGVVISEGLGGLQRAREGRYGKWLAAAGYATLVPDSFGARGFGDAAHSRRALAVTEAQMTADAFAALGALARHPRVDPRRIAVMGFSYGGMVTVLTAYRQLQQLFAEVLGDDRRFAAHASFYGCSVPRLEDPTTTGRPVTILLGARDRNVSMERSRAIADDLRRGGSEVDLQLLPDTYHQWDGDDRERRFVRFALRGLRMKLLPDNRLRDEKSGLEITGRFSRGLALGLSISIRGYHIQRSDAALARSDRLLLDFLDRTLGGRQGGAPGLRAVSEPSR